MKKGKLLTKLLSLVLCGVSAVSFTACGGNGGGGNKTASHDDLVVEVFGGGYGTDWIYAVANGFKNKTGNNVDITVQMGNAGISNMATSFASNSSETDIYFTKGQVFSGVYEGLTKINGVSYDCVYADMTDMYNTVIEGENITYKDKMLAGYESLFNIDDKYYSTSWAGGAMGIVVNMDVWASAGLTFFPRTTNELLDMADTIKTKNIAPFIYSSFAEYWTCIAPTFMAQYEGLNRIRAIYDGYDADGNRYTDQLADFDGYYETLVLYETLLKKENKYMHTASMDLDFTNMQGMFLQGMAAMSPNGDWLEKEMLLNYQNANIKLMKTPVISALSKKCSFKNAADADNKLRELVDYVDSHSDGYDGKPSWATNDDIDIVRDARSIEVSAGGEHIAFIPCYSNQVALAKQFLLYMASDEGMALYRSATNGCDLPFKWTVSSDLSNYTTFRTSVNDFIDKSYIFHPTLKNRLFALGGLNQYFTNNSYGRFVSKFSAINSKDFINAMTYYLAEQNYFAKNISIIKQRAGV